MARSLKLAQQNLLMIGIPLTFQILFVVILLSALSDVEKQYARESHLRVVMGSLNGLLNLMLSAAASEGMFQATQNKDFRKLFVNSYAESVKQSKIVESLLQEDHTADKNLRLMKELIDEMNITFSRGSKAMDSGSFDDMVQSFRQCRTMIEKALAISTTSVRQLELENQQNKLNQEKGKVFILVLIVFGEVLNFGITIALLRFIDRSNQNRFQTLADNITSLSMERPLQKSLEGDDEVARLDELLHQVNENLQQARRKEQAMIDNALDVICSLDRNFRFLQVNNAVSKQFLMDKDDLIGKSLSSLLLPEDREKTFNALAGVVASKSETSFENRIKLPNGAVKDMLWNVVFSGEEENLFCVAHDISGRKEVERLKQEVIAVVSHDLRAPLTSLGLTLNLLAEGGMGPLSEKAQNRVHKAEASVGQLISIINDLIDIEKFESGAISLEYKIFEGNELIGEAVSIVEGSAAAKNISIEMSSRPLTVTCDGQRIVRVLTNLLSNAIKFSPNNSTIKITCEMINAGIVFSVIDQGRGIAEDKLAIIFERWKQVEKEDETQKGGSGLGLAICKALIEAHGGQIEAVSSGGRNNGSTFRFLLPIKPPKPNR